MRYCVACDELVAEELREKKMCQNELKKINQDVAAVWVMIGTLFGAIAILNHFPNNVWGILYAVLSTYWTILGLIKYFRP